MNRLLSLMLCVLALVGCSDPHRSETIAKKGHRLTTVDIPASEAGGPFGLTGAQSVGQTFGVPAVDSVLQSIRFRLDLPVTPVVTFRAYVYAWSVANRRAVGPALFESAPVTSAGTGVQDYDFDVGAVGLAAGSTCVAFVSVSRTLGVTTGTGTFQKASGTFAGGELVSLANGSDTTGWTSGSWTSGGADDFAGKAVFVARASSSTTLSSTPAPSVVGQSVQLRASVMGDPTRPPTGTIEFTTDGVTLGTGTLVSGVATLDTDTLGVGLRNLSASYAGDLSNAPSAAPALGHTVQQAATTTAITATPNPATTGASVTFRATVSALGPGKGTPTGTVVFKENGTVLGSGVLATTRATFVTATLAIGSHDVTAEYQGDPSFVGSISAPVKAVINQDDAVVALSSSPNPSIHAAPVTFTATVSAGGPSGLPTGDVQFFDGATALGVVTLVNGVATLTTDRLTGGSHTIVANYGGDVTHGTATDTLVQIVSPAPSTVALDALTNPSVFGQSVTFLATVTGPGTQKPTQSIVFRDGGTVIGTVELNGAAQASLAIASLGAAAHGITATYGGDSNFAAATSPAVTQTVNRASTMTTLASSTNPSLVSVAVTFTANVEALAPGAGRPTGTVTFLDGATVIGTDTLNASGIARVTASALASGTHAITASYGTTTSFAGSASPMLSQVVNQQGVSVTMTSSLNPSTFGATVMVSARVVSSASTTPTGIVSFLDGATVAGTGTLDNTGTATFATASFAGGRHTLTARYEGDPSHTGGSTAMLLQIVDPAATSTTIRSTTNPSTYGQPITLTATAASNVAGNRTGAITFRDGATTLGVVAVNAAGAAALTTAALRATSHAITAAYSGDVNFAASTSLAFGQVVARSATTTTLLSSSNPSLATTNVTFTASVAAVAPGAGVPGGSVTFRDGATNLGVGALDAAGVATFATAALSAGAHVITATYASNSDFLASTSSALSQRVNTEAANISLVATPTPTTYGAVVTFRATLVGKAGVPIGTILFREGPSTLGTGALTMGLATFSTVALSAGPHTISAAYGGDNVYATGTGAVLHRVDKGTSEVTLSSSRNPAPVGTPIVLTASIASPGAGFTGQVQFFDAETSLGFGLVNGVIATLEVASLTAGGHAITAVYGGDINFAGSTSAALVQQVVATGDAAVVPGIDAGRTKDGGGGDGGCGIAGPRSRSAMPSTLAILALAALARYRRRACASRATK